MLCKANEVNFLSGPGRGVILIKLEPKDDAVIGFITATDDRDTLTVETSMGGEQRINLGRYEVVGRGGKGREIVKRGQLVKVIHEEPAPPVMLDEGKD
jgi:DNA gyrase subunit A